ADVAIAMASVTPQSVILNDELTYKFIVTSNGPAAAPGVTFSDPIPSGTTFVSASDERGTNLPNVNGTITGTIGDLAAGPDGTDIVTVVLQATAAGTVSNTPRVDLDLNRADDTNPSNNAPAPVNATVRVAQADLAIISATVSPPAAAIGQSLTYTIVVKN